MITANNMLITSKACTWELLINYFKQHYGNERTAADNMTTCMMTHQQIQQMFSEESDDEFFGFESILLICVCYTRIRLQGGLLVKNQVRLYTSIYSMLN